MPRIGRRPIEIPPGVRVKISEAAVEVQGPKGSLTMPIPSGVRCEQQDGRLLVRPRQASGARSDSDLAASLSGEERARWGLARALVANAIKGVTEGFTKQLAIVGVGYRAEVKGSVVVFSLGYSCPVEFPIPPGIQISVEKQTRVVVNGIDKQKVGQVAAQIRALRPPDPYKQKGIRYVGEVLRKKAGKAAAGITK
ncbi:MAG: 50S ribosomal protein L6 [Terriglobia bacterium]